MATQTIQIIGSENLSGTITMKAYTIHATTFVHTLVATVTPVNTAGDDDWVWAGAFTDLAAERHAFELYDDAKLAARDYATPTATTATFQCEGLTVQGASDDSVATAVIAALASGTEVFGHSYLDSIKRIEVTAGNATVTGAGTGTEVLTSEDSVLSATYTVDSSGNISAIVWA